MPYQVVMLNPARMNASALTDRLKEAFRELGLDPALELLLLDETTFGQSYDPAFPVAGVYLAADQDPRNATDNQILGQLAAQAAPLFPVVERAESFSAQTPAILHDFNGLFRSAPDHAPWPEKLANALLEGFGLLRDRRRLFISYLRKESQGIAEQLYGAFKGRAYDIFMDVHEVTPGKHVQQALMHRLVDSDLIVLLDSPGSAASQWVAEEIEMAGLNGVGLYHMIWPTQKVGSGQNPWWNLAWSAQRRRLDPQDFLDDDLDRLTPGAIHDTLAACEGLRARAARHRFIKLACYFRDEARPFGLSVVNQGMRHLDIRRAGHCVGRVKPLLGVPTSSDYHAFHNPANPCEPRRLFYHERGMQAEWLAHLGWLEPKLPVGGATPANLTHWLGGL